MRIGSRPQTITPEGWIWYAIRAGALGLLLAGAALAFEDHDSKKSTPGSAAFSSPAETRLREDVTYLAADEREGRGPGTRGIDEAADYISFVFKSSGLKPVPGAEGYFQPFPLSGFPALGKDQELAFAGPEGKQVKGLYKGDFTPLAIGATAKPREVPIVFAGYGITAKDDSLKLEYDDYADVDVKNKAVLIIRREPQEGNAKSRFDGLRTTRFATFQHKATNAFQHGAAAILLVNDRAEVKGKKDNLLRFDQPGSQPFSNIPFVMITRELADRLLSAAGQPSLEVLEDQIDAELKPKSRDLRGWTLSGEFTIERNELKTKNVIGMIEGYGPHADETVVIGGHYDHLGRGGLMSGSLAFLSHDIHNGADDNASGTAMVLELARRMGARRDPPPRRIVFMAFSAEERGLVGSQYYVDHPLIPLSSTVMMFNCDMVGRLNEKKELTMIGTGTSPGFDDLVKVLGRSAALEIKTVSGMTDGFGGSDHQSFYPKGIPVLFAFTGLHREYHRPSDDANLINYPGMARIADYLELLVLDVVRRPERPAFTRMSQGRGPRRADTSPTSRSAYLGARGVSSSTAKGTNGVRLEHVVDDSPASGGGLKAGDIITLFGGKQVRSAADLLMTVAGHKPGDDVEILVERDGKELKLRVSLGSPPDAGRDDPARRGSSVYLGTMPDYSERTEPGMKIQGVSEGSPAEKGGLKGGDVIIGIGDKKVGTIYDFMETLSAHKPGDEVDVVVQRDGKELKLRVKLGTRSGR